ARSIAKVSAGVAGPGQAVQTLSNIARQQSQLAQVAQQRPVQPGGGMGFAAGTNLFEALGIKVPARTGGVQQAGLIEDWLGEGGAAVAPYVADKTIQAFKALGMRPSKIGGTVLAETWSELFTPSGNLRGLVAVEHDGRISYMRNAGTPLIFSRDATQCRRMKKVAGRAYRASGGSTSARRKR
ncbi:unnamed protein product, partial [marine sediment metagenome]